MQVVTLPFGLRAVVDADGAFVTALTQGIGRSAAAFHRQEEARSTASIERFGLYRMP